LVLAGEAEIGRAAVLACFESGEAEVGFGSEGVAAFVRWRFEFRVDQLVCVDVVGGLEAWRVFGCSWSKNWRLQVQPEFFK